MCIYLYSQHWQDKTSAGQRLVAKTWLWINKETSKRSNMTSIKCTYTYKLAPLLLENCILISNLKYFKLGL